MFGSGEGSTPRNQQTELPNETAGGQLKMRSVKKYSGTDIAEAKTADSINENAQDEKVDDIVLHSLVPSKNVRKSFEL